jgi:hypothetical protein
MLVGGALARGEEPPLPVAVGPAAPTELPAAPVAPTELPAAVEEAPPAAATAPAAGYAAPSAEPKPADAKPAEAKACKEWWEKVPVVDKFPPLGWFVNLPTGPGYYSLLDWCQDNCRQAPPKYPYPRFGIIPWSFYNADWKYLDDPINTETDFFDPLKRIRLGDNWMFTTGGDYRYRYMNEVDSRLSGINNTYDQYRFRMYGDLWYQDLFRVYAEFLYAESLYNDLPPLAIDRDRGDLLNLFADVKVWETDKEHPIYFRIGRQELLYGSERLISPLDWANTRRTFQGAKLFYRGDKVDADLFVVQPVIPNTSRFDSVDNNQIFSGAWLAYRPKPGVWIDLYYLNLDNTNPTFTGRFGQKGGENVSTVGTRYFSNEPDQRLMWDGEGMLQFGEAVNQHILAKAFTTGVGWKFKCLPWDPQAWVYYDYASGDPDPGNSQTRRTFNQLFPFGHYYLGWLDLVGRQNINDINTQVCFFPAKWIQCVAQYHVFRLDSDKDALYSAGGAVLRRDPTGRAGNDVGEELDLLTNFHLSNHADLLIGYSHLYAGDFIKRTGPPGSPDFFYAQYSYRW